MALNAKQKAFVREYLKDKNGARSARAAGYTKKHAVVIASRLLTNANVRKAVNAGLEAQAKEANLDAAKIIREISKIAMVDLNKNELKKISNNKLKALELLGKHFKLFTDVTQLTGKDGNDLEIVFKLPPGVKDRLKEGQE